MRIKGLFILLVILLLVWGVGMLFLFSKQNSALFYLCEAGTLLVLIYLAVFYRKLVKPLHSIGAGIELLREQDFSSRLSSVGQYEADRIVNVFNRMMDQLKNERLRLREQNNFLDLLIKASPMGVVLTSLDGDLTDLNPVALKMYPLLFYRSWISSSLLFNRESDRRGDEGGKEGIRKGNSYDCTRGQ